MKKILKVIIINLVIFFSILGFVLLIPPLSYFLYNSSQKLFLSDDINLEDKRFTLPNYREYKWAKEYFVEENNLMTSYQDYTIWKFDDYEGRYINIINGKRKTINLENANKDTFISFFGGSTIFGTGADDSNTIPSLFAKKSNYYTNNYGNLNYVSRQSYEKLFNLYNTESNINNLIIFYDGINDVTNFCRSELGNDLNKTVLEKLIQDEMDLKTRPEEKYSFKQTFFQISHFIKSLNRRYQNLNYDINNESQSLYYDCHENETKAINVAKNLVNLWKKADLLASAHDDTFVAILQPVIFLGNSKSDHLNLATNDLIELRKQFLAVYPLILKYVKDENINFYNFTNVFNEYDDTHIYIDYCHVSPNGNYIVVDELIDKISNLKK